MFSEIFSRFYQNKTKYDLVPIFWINVIFNDNFAIIGSVCWLYCILLRCHCIRCIAEIIFAGYLMLLLLLFCGEDILIDFGFVFPLFDGSVLILKFPYIYIYIYACVYVSCASLVLICLF
jgi:hypothetical protein